MKTPNPNPGQSNASATDARIAALEEALLRVFRHFDSVTRIAPDEVRDDAREAHRAVEEIIYDVGLAHCMGRGVFMRTATLYIGGDPIPAAVIGMECLMPHNDVADRGGVIFNYVTCRAEHRVRRLDRQEPRIHRW